LNEKAPKIEGKYNLSSINISETDASLINYNIEPMISEKIITFKDPDLQKLNKNPLNQIDKKLRLQKKVYRKIDSSKPRVQEDFVNVKMIVNCLPPKGSKMPAKLQKI
jgi:hypothetical protein